MAQVWARHFEYLGYSLWAGLSLQAGQAGKTKDTGDTVTRAAMFVWTLSGI